MKRILFFFAFVVVSSGAIFAQGSNCASATPFCGSATFANNTSTVSQSGPSYGCLLTQPNPAWFFVKTTGPGNMVYNISQVNTAGTGIDVDFIAWGPFPSMANACNTLTGSCTGDHACSGNIEDCGYSTAAVETMTLVSPGAGQYYVILITNYADQNGTITFNQTSGPPSDCSITCPTVTSGNGYLLTNGSPVPSTVACSTAPFGMIASNNTPFGNPITPGVMISFTSNTNNTLQINWLENAAFVLCAGPVASGCGIQIPTNTNEDIQFSTMSPSATNDIQFCETSTADGNMPYQIVDVSSGTVLNSGTWVTDALCTTVSFPPGTISGVATWSISPACPGCMTTTDWGYAVFNPGVAPAGTYNVCYSFDPPGTCPTYTYCQNITVTNPNNPAWTTPAAMCTTAGSINLNTLVTGTAGGTWSGTGVSGNTFNPAVSGAGTFNVTYVVGSGSCSATQSHTITVNPSPVATATPTSQTICSGGTTGINLSSNIGGTTFNWTVSQTNATGATAGSGATIAQALTATGTTPGSVTYTITPVAGGCTGTPISVTITVNPKPVVTATPAAQTICSGNSTSISLTSNVVGTTFSWTVVQSGVTGATAGSGSSIVQTLNTSGAATGTATYTIIPTAGGCAGNPVNVVITVNPIPNVTATPTTQTICSGSNTSIALSGTVAGTTFSWTVTQAGATGATAGSGTSIAQALTATGTSAGTVVYTVTPSLGGCNGTPVAVTITVNPRPVVTPTPASQTFCSGGTTSISLTSNIPGTTYTWTATPSGVTGSSAGSGSSIVQTLSTSGAATGTVVYAITPTAGGCTGTPVNVTITVNPVPNVVATPASQTICSGSASSISLTGSVAGTVFNWTVSQSGVTGATAGSGNSIAQTLTTTGASAGTATYTITPSIGGCTGTPIAVTITVNPAPSATATPSSQTICSGSSTGISLSGSVAGTTFSWTVSQSGVSGGAAGSGSTITQVLTATGTTAGTATYTIIPSFGGCAGAAIIVPITVNPKPVVTATPASQTICSGTSSGINLTSNIAGTTFSWTVVQTNVSGASPGSGASIAQVLTATTASSGTAVYTITPTAGGCTGNPITVTITVTPRDNASFTYSSSTYCQTGTDPAATITGLAGGTFTATPAGLVFLNVNTGLIDVSASTLNTYTVTYTTSGPCPNTSTVNITISSAPSATFSYAGPYCKSAPNPFPTFGAGASAGTFTSSPAGLVFVNVNTGQINLSSSTAGTYTVTNTIAASGGCASAVATASVTISPTPVATATPSSQNICSGSATSIALSSSIGGTTYTWTVVQTGVSGASAGSGSSIAQTLSTTGTVPGSAVYTVTPTAGGCAGSPITVTINVNPIPTVTATPTTQTICSGGVTSVLLSGNVATATYSWTVVQTGVSGAAAGSGTGISQTLSATGTSAGTAVYTVTPTANGCPGTPVTVTVTVNPIPSVTATPSTQTLCSGSTTGIALSSATPGATFSWTVSQSGVSGGSAGSGSSIAQALSTTGTVPGSATYTITPSANGCTGTPILVTINVNPIPVATATPSTQTICSGTPASVTLSGSVTGTTFAWTVTQTGVSGGSAGSGSSIAQTLIATGSSPGTAVYSVTPTANGCSGTPITVTVTVNPVPFATATPSSQTLCSGGTTGISLTSFTAGTTFSWTVSQSGVSGATAGTGSSIAQVLTTTGSTTGTATYSITPSANGCSGTPISVIITVNPVPVVTATPTVQTICSGTATSISLSSNVAGATFAWTVSQTNASGASAGSGSSIAQALTATTTAAGSVVYTITPSANGCTGLPVTVTITVNPSPNVIATPASQTICSGATTGISLSGSVAGTSFTWTASQTNVSGAAGGAGTSIAQVLTATASTPGTADYTITPTANGCVGTPSTVTVTVNPTPVVTATPVNQTICSGATTSIALTSNVAGTTFTWTSSQSGATGGGSGSGSTIAEVLTATGTSPGSVTYTITPSASGCASSTPITVVITVNPLPSATATPSTQNICDGAATGIALTSNLGATTFDWTVAQTNVTGAVAGSGTSISQLLDLVSATTAGSAVYTITPTDNGCPGTPVTVTVNVNPIDNAAFSYSSSTYCQTGTDPSANITGTPGGVFSVLPSTGLVMDTLSGLIDLSASALGTYNITYQTNGVCPSNSIVTVTLTTAPSALFGYALSFCSSDPNPTPGFGPGASAGVFTASPAGLVFVDPATGEIDLTGSAAGTYTITNTIAAGGGCAAASAMDTVTISQAATVNAGLNDTICELGTLTLNGVMGGSAGSVLWTTNGSGSFNDATLLGPVYTPSAADVTAGTVVLTITTNDPAGGCNAVTDFAVLSITPLDSATFSYSGSTFCQSGTDPVPTVTGVAGGVFSATPAGISFISTSTGEIDLSASTLGTYTVVYTTNGPCPSTDTAIVTITTAPVATFSFSGAATSFCQSGSNPTPVFASGASAGAFTATPAGLVFVSPSTGQVDLANSAPGTYTIVNNIVPAGGCASAVDSLTITINVPATVNAGTDTAVCAGGTYTAAGSIGGSANSATWTSGGSGTFDNAALLNATYTPSAADTTAGAVTLYLTTDDPTGVCNAVLDSMVLTITPLPQAPSVTNPSPYCAGSTVGPITFAGAGGSVNWYSDAGLTTNIGTGNPFTPTGITGTTTIYATETVGSCTSYSSAVTITFNPLPVADSTNMMITGATCGDSTGAITGVTIVSGQNPYTYLWQDVSGNNVGDSLNLTNVGPGVYTLTITDGNGCVTMIGGGSAFTVTSTSGVMASFTATPSTGEKPLPVSFTNTSTGGVNYLWQFPNGSTDTSFNSSYIFTQLGTNSVCLIADNGVGCIDTACTTIDVFINSVFVIPNVFTPNGDNVNDIFTVKNVGLETMDAEIYNRWGQKEYEWHTTNGGWDGRTAAGVLVPDGTYFFIISAKGYDGKEYFEKGSFELIR
ncbi:MAG: hypothetical protein JWO44_2207 [Bacteroidetes bacterium]|nr:hypothetical protein [Bacteroidota bacterium]